MAYTPPDNGAVNFSEEGSYSPPDNDAVNFSEPAEGDIVASTAVVQVTAPDPTVATSLIQASAAEVSVSAPAARFALVINASAGVVAVDAPAPAIGLSLVASTANVTVESPDAGVAPSSGVSIDPSVAEVDVRALSPRTVSLLLSASTAEVNVSAPGANVSAPGASVGFGIWQVAGYPFRADNVESTAKDITLSAVLARYRLKQIRSIRRDAEKVGVVVDDEGRFRAVDRSLDGNTYTVTPPLDEDPPHETADMLVAGYNESRAAKQENKKNVEVTLQRPESRDATGGERKETAGSGEWLFEFHTGDIATDRVTPEQETVIDVAEDVESLQLVLTAEQVLVLETSATYPDAVSVVEIPDGQNLAEDNSSTDRQTVEVTAPTAEKEDVLATGTYVVADWTSTRLDSNSYEVSLDLRPKA